MGGQLKHFGHDNQAPRAELVRLSQPAERTRERTRFAQVLEDAADLLERHGELPDAVRWLRKEARAWRG
jgi:hypothetical protein